MLIVLAIAALVAGATGSWSPCGLSMIDTLGARGRALAAFAIGTLAGGVVVFGGLALLGSALGVEALGVAAAIALGAALLELTGRPVTPQIRRQVPEPWRRVLPLPVAGLGYGVLLGMGFTTFVLSYAVPALAAIVVALGDPAAGLVVGLGFGLGRALPIVVLGPLSGRESGLRAMEAMSERPGLLRSARVGDGVALLALAGTFAATASGAVVAHNATDPSVDDSGGLAWQVPGGEGRLRVGDSVRPLPTRHPALGGGWIAATDGSAVHALRAEGAVSFPATGVSGVAVARRWIAWRAGGRITAVRFADGKRRTVGGPSLSRPALAGDLLAWAEASRRGSRIRSMALESGRLRTIRREPRALLGHPALRRRSLAYVRQTANGQQLRVGRAAPRSTGRDRVLLSVGPLASADAGHEPGHTVQGRGTEHSRRRSRWMLWSTALTAVSAYVTRFDPRSGRSSILRVGR